MCEEVSENSLVKEEPVVGCEHYIRKCHLECPSCLQFFPCRLCHDDENSNQNHQLDRFAVQHLKCLVCGDEQDVCERCKNCGEIFGKYCCLICNMFDDCDRKQYHCAGCGLCRVGGRENFFHCDKCGLCLSNEIKDSHRCVEKSSKSNCPVCLEDMHSSRENLKVPSCGHLIHQVCYAAMLKHGDYRCAICGKSTMEMSRVWEQLNQEIESTPMPEEYANTQMWILCRDCQAVSSVKFHILGMKCTSCGSYNTCGTESPNGGTDESIDELD